MLPRWHALLGAIFSIFIYYYFKITLIEFLLIFLAAVFIDADHYLWYVVRKKDWNLKNAYKWFRALPRRHKSILVVFHTAEFILLIFLVSIYFPIFLFIFTGLIFHSLLDVIDMVYHKDLVYREFSLVRYFILKNKRPNKYL